MFENERGSTKRLAPGKVPRPPALRSPTWKVRWQHTLFVPWSDEITPRPPLHTAVDLQLPINAPQEKARAHTNQRDGQMASYVDADGENKHINYEPSLLGCLQEAPKPAREYHQWVEGHLGRYQTSRTTDDYKQAGDRYRTFEDWERDDLIANIGGDLKQCPEPIQLRMAWHFWHCDEDYGRRVAQMAGIDLEKAKALPPLPGRPAPHQRRTTPTYTDGRPEEPVPSHEPAVTK